MVKYKTLLTWCAVSLGSYAGTLLRYGWGFYKGGATSPANFTGLLLANCLGSFVLGVISEWQAILAPKTAPRLFRVFYSGIASGFCGSLTTFSGWNAETAKLFLQQIYVGSDMFGYNGGYVFQWSIGLWLGLLLPLGALRSGQHAASCLRSRARAAAKAEADAVVQAIPADTEQPDGSLSPSPVSVPLESGIPHWHTWIERALPVVYVIVTVALIAAPVPTGWERLTLATTLGSLGAYVRYRLAPLNKPGASALHSLFHCKVLPQPLLPVAAPLTSANGLPDVPSSRDAQGKGKERGILGWCSATYQQGNLPYGTLIVNALGTWLLAVFTVLSVSVVPSSSTGLQSLLFGLGLGFCGCLTTMSTLALEVHRLPTGPAYVYTLLSYVLAQAGWLLITGLSLGSQLYP